MAKKGSIDRQLLVDAALKVVERVGFDGLTMRMVADELGVSAMAAYRHVPSRDVLINLVTDRLAASVQLPGPDAGPWDERLVQIERAAFRGRAVFPGQPDPSELMGGGPHQDRIVNAVMDILIEAGLRDDEAAMAFQVLWAYFNGQLRVSDRWLRQRADGVGSEPPMSPMVARVLASVPSATPEDFFEWGLEVFLDGLRARLEAQSAQQQP